MGLGYVSSGSPPNQAELSLLRQLAGKEKWINFRWITLVCKTLGGAVR